MIIIFIHVSSSPLHGGFKIYFTDQWINITCKSSGSISDLLNKTFIEGTGILNFDSPLTVSEQC